MGYLFRVQVNLALGKLGVDPTHVSNEFRQLMQLVGQGSGNSPQETALWIASQMPLIYRAGINLGTVKAWIRNRKINPDDPEMQRALEAIGWPTW